MKVSIQKRILDVNEQAAAANAAVFAEKKVLCLNMISSPGSGKTTILARTIEDLKGHVRIGVIEGDLQTDLDAQRIRKTGAPAIQIETSGACHLTAQQVSSAMKQLPIDTLNIVVIENVGNLVCPSAFELGESARVVVLSTAEGDDKPAKYPGTFAKANVVLINKTDLLGHVDFDMDKVRADALALNPHVRIFAISARTEEGLRGWYDYLLALSGK